MPGTGKSTTTQLLARNHGDRQPDQQHFASDRPKIDLIKHHRIYVRGLSLEMDTNQLRRAFSAFGEISECYMNKMKRYGFCSFVRKEDAAEALKQMNGHELGGRRIRTEWCDSKPPSGEKPPDYKNSTSPNNCNVYVVGVSKDGVPLRRAFNQFGRVLHLCHFKERGYASLS